MATQSSWLEFPGFRLTWTIKSGVNLAITLLYISMMNSVDCHKNYNKQSLYDSYNLRNSRGVLYDTFNK